MSGLGLTNYDYEQLQTKFAAEHNYTTKSTDAKSAYAKSASAAYANSESGNTCTDGKDDGKIGLFSAIGHTIKGAVKGVFNGIKGMFTNKEGKFSLLKTIGTVALGAACIAFPAVGLVACGIGAVTGGAKLVKGVVTAATAKSDAEAKDAWEAVGDGGLTVAMSVVGAKASLNAVKSSSTAGLSNLDDAAAAVAKADGKTSALSQLEKNASVTKKIGALGKDMWSSTKNNALKLTDFAKVKHTELQETAKAKTTEHYAKEYLDAKEALETAKKSGDAAKIKEAQTNLSNIEQSIKKDGASLSDIGSEIQKLKETQTKITAKKAEIAEVEERIKVLSEKAKAQGLKETPNAIKYHQENLATLNKELKALEGGSNVVSKATSGAKSAIETVKTTAGKSSTLDYMKSVKSIRAMATKSNFKNILNAMSQDKAAIIKSLNSSTFAATVNKYGYANVTAALEAFAAEQLASESV